MRTQAPSQLKEIKTSLGKVEYIKFLACLFEQVSKLKDKFEIFGCVCIISCINITPCPASVTGGCIKADGAN